jgi:tRNA-specific 2-thiouridylase
MARVIVGMSGGVDSSVCAHLLKEEGHEVEGVSFVLWEARDRTDAALCCSFEARDSAGQTAAALGVSHRAIDVRGAFFEAVIHPFVEAYKKGITPNPCILCNRYIKFPYLMRAADEAGAKYIATGHYAKVERGQGPGGRGLRTEAFLRKGIDRKKDQSYVLYVLKEDQLDRLLLPLGDYTKNDVRQAARSLSLPAADRPESQEICFIEDRNYGGFLERFAPEVALPGPIIGAGGDVIGTHKGICFYTIGQRKGLGIPSPQPHYVRKIDPVRNIVYVGSREQAMSDRVVVGDINWLLEPSGRAFRASVKVRSMMEARAAELAISDDSVQVIFDEPLWAPAPGQSAVFYDGDVVLGGGIIMRSAAEFLPAHGP